MYSRAAYSVNMMGQLEKWSRSLNDCMVILPSRIILIARNFYVDIGAGNIHRTSQPEVVLYITSVSVQRHR